MTASKYFAAAVLATAAAFVALGCQSSPTLPDSPPPGAIIVSANQLKFEQAVVNAHASVPFTIWFENRETVPHNVNVRGWRRHLGREGRHLQRPSGAPLEVPALAQGNYRLICDVHPDMSAQLIAD